MTDAERLKLALALLEDKDFIRAKADYNRGHLSYANWLNERTKGLYDTETKEGPLRPESRTA